MAYVSLGTELVVTAADLPRAQAEAQAIVRDNERLEKAYRAAQMAYQTALSNRQAAISKYDKEKADYQAALAKYEANARGIGASNGVATAAYNAELARWQEAYNRAYAYGQAVSQKAAEDMVKSRAIFAKYGVAPPPGFTGCVSAADHAAYVDLCRQQSARVTVKGIGAIQVTPGTPGCAYAEIPVCVDLGPKPPAAGVKPSPPALTPMPKKPSPPAARVIPPAPSPPLPPVLREVPTVRVKESGAIVPPAGGFSGAGLLAAAALLVGGGAAVYYYRKKKAKTA